MSGIIPYLKFSQYIAESHSAVQLIYLFENKLNAINDKSFNELNDFFGEKPSRKRIEQVEKIIREFFGHLEIHISIVWKSDFYLRNNKFEKYNIDDYFQNIIINWGNGFSLIRLNYFGDKKVVIDQEISKIYEPFRFEELKEFYYTIIEQCSSEYCIYFTQNIPDKIIINSINLNTNNANEELYEFAINYLKEKYQNKYSAKIIKSLLYMEIEENCEMAIAD